MASHSTKRQFLSNIGSGWLATLVTGFFGMIILPMNLKYLGKDLYGISCLASNFLAIFSFLNFGMAPTLVRFFSQAIVSEDRDKFRRLCCTAQIILGGFGAIGGLAFLVSFPQFVTFYSIPDSSRVDLFVLFIALSLSFWESLFLIPFFSIVQANQRYDYGNINRIIAIFLRLTTLWVGYRCFAPSLLILALSTFVGTFYILCSIFYLVWRLHHSDMFFHRKYIDLSLLKPLFSFSMLSMVARIFFGLSMQLPLMIIGKTLGLSMVAAFTPALALSSVLWSILSSITLPLIPIASREKIKNDGKNLGEWSLIMSEVVACFGSCAIVGLVLLGNDFIFLWLGKDMEWIHWIVVINVAGMAFASIQNVNNGMAIGASTIFPDAISCVVMAILTTLGTFVGTYWGNWSLLGVVIWITFVRLLRNPLYLAFVYSRLFVYDFWRYTWRVNIKPFLLCFIFAFIGYFLKKQLNYSSNNWLSFIIGCVVIASVYGLLCWYFVLDEQIKSRLTVLKKAPRIVQKILRVKC